MQYEVRKELKVLLTLNEDEIVWLRDYMQNPMEGYKNDEPDYVKNNRHKLFEILKDALKK
jgi:hypothetical protein